MIPSVEDRQAIIEYRKERSYQALKEAEYVAKGGFWNLTANRLYYSALYMCMALLISEGISASTHEGVSRMMNLFFIKTGKLRKEEGKLLGKLFRMRKTGDYDDLSDWEEEEILPLFPKVKELVDKICSLIILSEK